MIEKYDNKYAFSVNRLGSILKSNYDVKRKGELEEILVYLKGEDVIAFVQYVKLYETVEICYIVVDSNYRSLGIGSEFIEYFCRDLDVGKIVLEVRVSNERAISFYEKNGFKRVRPIKNYYADGEDALSMEKVVR